jgi:monofunctional biosynthetic peptidoglycan transglycosylase
MPLRVMMRKFTPQAASNGEGPRAAGDIRTGDPSQGRRPSAFARLVAEAPAALVTSVVAATKVLVASAAAVGVVVAAVLLLFRYVDPPGSMLMLGQWLSGTRIEQEWVSLDRISPNLVRAVIASEDGAFCRHAGIDFDELNAAMEDAIDRSDAIVRGASTITMQVAKNLFLAPTRSLARKGVEMGLAVAMEAAWPKRRILEIYLNIAEWGPGVFGAQTGAQHHFKKPAARLRASEAALMAVALPNPRLRRPGRPGPGLQRLATTIEARVRAMGPARVACVLAPEPQS